MKVICSVVVAALAAGCASDFEVRSSPPEAIFVSAQNVDAAVTCLVGSLQRNYQALMTQRFVAQTIAPGAEYDIVPTDGFINGHWIYTVNVKSRPGGSEIRLFKVQPMLTSITAGMVAGIAGCGATQVVTSGAASSAAAARSNSS
jgi:hypothetical protein